MKLKALFTLTLAGFGLSLSAQTIASTTPANKNVVLEELTGKTCQFCPDGHLRAQQFKDANPGRVVLLNIHAGSYAQGTPNYRTTWGNYVDNLFPVGGYPTGAVNRRVMPDGTQANPSQTNVMTSRGYWASNGATVLAESSPVNVGGIDTIDLDSREIKLEVEAYYTAAGPGTANKFHAILMQNNVPGPQTAGATYNPGAILPNGDYNHMHMVRYAFTPNVGDNIATIAATSLYTNTYNYTAPAAINSITLNLADVEIALYVSEGAATGAILTGAYSSSVFKTNTPLGITNTAATLDASLNAVCGTTVDANMQITNMGGTPLTTATFEYTVNGGTPGTYQHTFTNPLATGQYQNVTIPAIPGLAPNGGFNTVNLSVSMLNGVTNPNTNGTNGLTVVTAGSHTAPSTSATVSITTDAYGSETTWSLIDETTGSTVMQGGPYADLGGTNTQVQTPVNGTLVDNHCYKFEINDAYGDGMCCTYGSGSYSLTIGGTTVSSGSSFSSVAGRKFVLNPTVTSITTVQEGAADMRIMPNPVHSHMTVEFTMTEMTDASITILNALGQRVQQVANTSFDGTNTIEINTGNLVSGVYFLNITSDKGTSTKRFVVEK